MNTIQVSTPYSGTSANTLVTGNIGSTTTTTGMKEWTDPHLTETNEVGESIEFIYTQESLRSNYFGAIEPRVFKIIFSCIEGKWNKSEPVFGKIIPTQSAYYDFD